MSFRNTKACFPRKIVYIFCMQAHTKVFQYITVFGGGLNCIITYLYCTKYNKIDTCHIQNNYSYEQWSKYYQYYAYRLARKFPDTLRLLGRNF